MNRENFPSTEDFLKIIVEYIRSLRDKRGGVLVASLARSNQLSLLKIKKILISKEEELLEKHRNKIKKSINKDKLSNAGPSRRAMSSSSSDLDSTDDSSPSRSRTRPKNKKIYRSSSKYTKSRSRTERSCSKDKKRSRKERYSSKRSRSRSRKVRSRSRSDRSPSRRRRSYSKVSLRSRARSPSNRRSRSRNDSRSRLGHTRGRCDSSRRSPSRISWYSRSLERRSSNRSPGIGRQLQKIQGYESQDRSPPRKAIDYRSNISDKYITGNRRTQNSAVQIKNQPSPTKHKETIIVNSTIIKKENAMRIAQEELEEKKKEAIKDILLDLEKPLNSLSTEHEATDVDRKTVLYKMFEKINMRMKRLKVKNSINVSNIVMHYRCKYSKVEDEFALGEIFNNVIVTNRETKENDLMTCSDPLLNELDTILQDFDLNLLEDRKPKIEPVDDIEEGEITDDEEEGQITNIVIKIVPTASLPSQQNGIKQLNVTEEALDPDLYIMEDREYGYYVHITAKYTKKKRYYLAKKRLIKQMIPIMRKLSKHIEFKLFKFVIEIKLEEIIRDILKNVFEKVKTIDLIELFRQIYPEEKDDEFLLDILCAVWRGEYNDSARVKEDTSELDLNRVKQENESTREAGTSRVKTELLDPVVVAKTEKTDTVNNNVGIREKNIPETEKDIKTEKRSEKPVTNKTLAVMNDVTVKNETITLLNDKSVTNVTKALINDEPVTNVTKALINDELVTKITKGDEILILEPMLETIDLSDEEDHNQNNLVKKEVPDVVNIKWENDVIELSDD